MVKAKETFVFQRHMTRWKPNDFVGWVLYFEPGDAFSRVEEEEEEVFKVESTCHSKKNKKNIEWGQKHAQCYCLTSTVLFVSFNVSIRNGLLHHSGHLSEESRLHLLLSEEYLKRETHRAAECMFSNPLEPPCARLYTHAVYRSYPVSLFPVTEWSCDERRGSVSSGCGDMARLDRERVETCWRVDTALTSCEAAILVQSSKHYLFGSRVKCQVS